MAAVFWTIASCSLVLSTLMMEAVTTSETSVNINHTTLWNIPQDSHLHNRCLGNLKYHRIHQLPFSTSPPTLLTPTQEVPCCYELRIFLNIPKRTATGPTHTNILTPIQTPATHPYTPLEYKHFLQYTSFTVTHFHSSSHTLLQGP
jgi:hypothetical protein